MKPKTMILMVVAIGCGLGASYMTSRLLADRSNTKDTQAATVKVLVAKKKVPAFELIKKPEDYFDEKEVPEGTYPAKCLKTFDEVRNQRLLKARTEDETVFKEDILSGDKLGIIANLPEGERAVAIPVNPVSLAGGFVLPGSRVDLIGSEVNNTGEVTSETFMQNMLVLAVDQSTNRDDRQSMLGGTVTFACTLEECQRLTVANKAMDIRLVLRSPSDKVKQNVPRSKRSDLGKPPTDGGRPGEGTGEEGTGDAVPGSVLVKGKEPKETKTEALPVGPKTEDPQPVAVAPPAPVLHKHTLTIENGEYTVKQVFVKNENGEWGRNAGDSDEESSRTKSVKPSQPVPPPVQPVPAEGTK